MKSSRQDLFSIANIIAETKTSATAEINKINEGKDTVLESHRKSRIQHCERSELRLHVEWTKID